MKKITLIISFLFVSLLSYSQCNYTLEMNDSYGDGWGTGNSIDLTVGGVTTNYTLSYSSGSSSSVEFAVTSGDDITAEFVCGGSYCYEASYRILDSSGVELVDNAYTVSVDSGTITANCPSCAAPSALSAASITVTSAEISWTSDDSSFNIEVVDVTAGGTATGTATYSGVTSPHSLSGLSSSNDYEVYVQTDCGAEDTSAWAGPVSFTTLCSSITSFPYLESFETITSGQPDCWSVEGTTTTASYHFSSYSTGFTGRGLRFNSYFNSAGRTSELITQTFDASSLPSLQLKFYYKNPSGGDFEVFVSSDLGSTFTSVASDLTNQSDWAEIIIDLSTHISNGVVIKFKGTSNYGSGDAYIYLDEVMLREIPSCSAPTALSAASITATSAEISWTAGGTETDYEYVVQAAGTGEPTAAGTAVNGATTVSASGLVANTDYEVYVRSNCGSEFSSWTGPVSFTTLCSSITSFPYLESFETITSGQPDCWSVEGTTTTASYHFSSYSTGFTGRGLRFNSYFNSAGRTSELITQTFDASSLPSLQLKFYYKNPSGGDFEVFVSSDLGSTFTSVASDLTNQSDWAEIIIDLSTHISNGVVIKFKGTSNYGSGDAYIYLDEVMLREIPSCSAPTALSVASITTTSADISWTSDGTLFNIEYGPAGFTQGSGTSDTSATASYALTGLNSGSAYDVYVQTDCGATDGTSSWSLLNLSTLLVNDSCDTATVLDALPFTSNADATAATNNNGSIVVTDCGFGMNDGVWYTFTPTVSGTIDLVIDPTGWDPEIAVYNGSCGVFTCVDSADMGGSSDSESLSIAVTAGTQYFVNLGHYSSTDNSEGVYEFRATSTDASLGIQEASMAQFTYFPNPVNDVLTIKAQKTVEDITVFNMLGQVVKRQTPNTRDCTVDLSAMQSGAYFVQVSIDNTVETVRVLKN